MTASGYDGNTRLLMADGSTKEIRDIALGDRLMGITGSLVSVTNCRRVDNTESHIKLYKLNLAWDNIPLIMTANQPALVRNNFKPSYYPERQESRADSYYSTVYFDGEKVVKKKVHINPAFIKYASQQEAKDAAIQYSDSFTRKSTSQEVYDLSRDSMYMVTEHENYFAFGPKQPANYYLYWPKSAKTKKKKNIEIFDTKEEALERAQELSREHIVNRAYKKSADPSRPGFFFHPEKKRYEVSALGPDDVRVQKLFQYDEDDPTYKSKQDTEKAVKRFIEESVNNSTTFVKPGPIVVFPVQKLVAMHINDRQRLPFIFSPGPSSDSKNIPDVYRFNSRRIRLKLLVGLIDSDGSYNNEGNYFYFVQAAAWHTRLFHDVVFLARSLGFYCTVPKTHEVTAETSGVIFDSWSMNISGDIEEVPYLLPRKQPRTRIKSRSHLQLPVRSFEEVERDVFYELNVEDHHQFLREDFLVISESLTQDAQTITGSNSSTDITLLDQVFDEEKGEVVAGEEGEAVAGESLDLQKALQASFYSAGPSSIVSTGESSIVSAGESSTGSASAQTPPRPSRKGKERAEPINVDIKRRRER